MVVYDYSRGTLLKNPENTLKQFSFEMMIQRQKVINNIKNKKVKVMLKNKEVKECYFQDADMTHFTYKFSEEDSPKKTLLKNLILRD